MAFMNFHYAISLAQSLYEVEGDTEDLEEIGLVAFDLIGNKRTRLYRASLEVGEDGSVALPCNCDIIESVTYCGPEDWAYTSNIHEYGDTQSSYTENYIEDANSYIEMIQEDDRLKSLWNSYVSNYEYAKDITFEDTINAIKVINELVVPSIVNQIFYCFSKIVEVIEKIRILK